MGSIYSQVPTFGLRVTLNAIDSKQIRTIDRDSLDVVGRRTREQVARAGTIAEFGINLDQDLVRAVTGKPQDKALGGVLSGADGLVIHLPVVSKDLGAWFEKLDVLSRDKGYLWARTGPALEAYSQHPAVKKANDPGELMTVREFLEHVRRIVVNFVVGRVLFGEATREEASGLDDVTTYYLLHRHDFGMEDAPVGACILYAISCGLDVGKLADQHDLLLRTGGRDEADETEDAETAEEEEQGSGSKVKLKPWQQRRSRSLGEGAGGRTVLLIDQVHRLMHLWKTGEVVKVNEYLDARALRQSKVFHQLLQALIELAPQGSEERSLLEKMSNHVAARGVSPQEELQL